jgi:predicted O-linked N-acetylglucosamine transferase (SPINDLY family)
MRGRLGAGALDRLSIPELVAPDPEAFIERAAWLAEDHAARSALRRTVSERLTRVYRDGSVVASLEACLLELLSKGAQRRSQ